jgi:hypothetical protein
MNIMKLFSRTAGGYHAIPVDASQYDLLQTEEKHCSLLNVTQKEPNMKKRPKTALVEWQDVPLTNQLCRDVKDAA